MNLAQGTSLEIVLESAHSTEQIEWTVSYYEITQSCCGSIGASECSDSYDDTGLTNDTTPVTMVSVPSSPADSTQSVTRKVTEYTVYNSDSVDANVIIQINNGSTIRIFQRVKLKPKELTIYQDDTGIR